MRKKQVNVELTVLTDRNTHRSAGDREFRQRSRGRDAADFAGSKFREPESAIRRSHDPVWKRTGSQRVFVEAAVDSHSTHLGCGSFDKPDRSVRPERAALWPAIWSWNGNIGRLASRRVQPGDRIGKLLGDVHVAIRSEDESLRECIRRRK